MYNAQCAVGVLPCSLWAGQAGWVVQQRHDGFGRVQPRGVQLRLPPAVAALRTPLAVHGLHTTTRNEPSQSVTASAAVSRVSYLPLLHLSPAAHAAGDAPAVRVFLQRLADGAEVAPALLGRPFRAQEGGSGDELTHVVLGATQARRLALGVACIGGE